jgi:hypothetical protein
MDQFYNFIYKFVFHVPATLVNNRSLISIELVWTESRYSCMWGRAAETGLGLTYLHVLSIQ